MGDMGDMGDIGMAAMTAGSVFSLAVDYSTTSVSDLWTIDSAGIWALKAPPTAMTINTIRAPTAVWTGWDGRWHAWLILAQFAATTWQTFQLPLWDPSTAAINAEIDGLLEMAEAERSNLLGEIIAQNARYEDFMSAFIGVLRITRGSHPKMFQILHVAGIVGILVSMYYKQNPGGGRAPRPRPTQLCPALAPPIPIPGHPAFPSGHATQSMLMALCAGHVLETRNGAQGGGAVWHPILQSLSARIARNREVAGFHYTSDSHAGFHLARQTFDKLRTLGLFNQLVDEALNEWPA